MKEMNSSESFDLSKPLVVDSAPGSLETSFLQTGDGKPIVGDSLSTNQAAPRFGQENYSFQKQALIGILHHGESKGFRPATTIICSGFLGGIYIAFGAALYVHVLGLVGNPVVSGLLFPAGLSFVVSSGADLLTSNMMYATLPLLNRQQNTKHAWVNLARLILFSLIGNALGCLVFAWLSTWCQLFDSKPLFRLATKKTTVGPLKVFVKAIGANWMVNLAIFQSFTESNFLAKIPLIWLPIATFVILGLEHFVANLFFLPAAVFTGFTGSLWKILLSNLLPCFCGNFVGAIIFVSGQKMLANKQIYGQTRGSHKEHV